MTLRSAYFADWKGRATALFWGDASGMRDLANFLRHAWAAPNVPTLDRFCEAIDGRMIAITSVSHERDTGMRLTGDGLEWRLRPRLAEDFAEMVDVLASYVSGHQYLESGSDITVEVSIGEYPETLRPDDRGF